jgi:class 3 adenylate cyclase
VRTGTAPAATAVATERRDSGGIVVRRRSRPDGGGVPGRAHAERRTGDLPGTAHAVPGNGYGSGNGYGPACGRCGSATGPTDRYCRRCGTLLIVAAPQEERRTVSVLFVDMVGFTSLAAAMDPEDVRAIQNEYFHAVSQVIQEWNGVVEKYVGDAVMAVFGVPRSHEYDAYRAVGAALQLRQVLNGHRFGDGLRIRTRVGVATGEAVVDLAARDGSQALVSGDVVNTASRIQAYAAEGTAVVTAATRQATGAFVRYRLLPPARVAGKSEPLELWQACAIEDPGTAVTPDDDSVPMVGRHAEFTAIMERLTLAISDRVPQLVSVVGPAGAGKSRLVREVAHQIGANPEVCWQVGHCSPHGGGRYQPLAEMISRLAGFADGGAPNRRELATWVDELFGPAACPPGIGDALAALLGTAGSGIDAPDQPAPDQPAPDQPAPDWPRDATERAWQRVLLTAASRRPLIIVVEDLHRADPTMVRFLWDLFEAAAASPEPIPLAILVTYRPELPQLVDPSYSDHGHVIFLRPLESGQAGRLLRHLLDRAGRCPTLVDRLLPLIDGNPLYAHEYVRALGEDLTTVATPERVRVLISARLDHLDDLDRSALQAAAVVGQSVWPDALAAVLDTDPEYAHLALRRLHAHDLLVRRADSAIAGQPEYAFAEVAVRLTAYGQLPRAVRAERHRRAAQWFDTMAESGRGDLADLRVQHWTIAQDLARTLHWDIESYLVGAQRAFAAAARHVVRKPATTTPHRRAYRLRVSHCTPHPVRRPGPRLDPRRSRRRPAVTGERARSP